MITARSLSKREYEIMVEVARSDMSIFTIRQISAMFKKSKKEFWPILHRLVRKGWLERIEKGKYMHVPFKAKEGWLEHPYLIVAKLLKNYYISYRAALSYYGLTEQLPHYVYVATTQRKREKVIQDYTLKFIRMKPDKFFGYKTEMIDGQEVMVAESEKAIIDCLDHEEYSGSIVEIVKAINETRISHAKLKKYAIRMGNSSLIRRLGYLMDMVGKNSSGLEKHIGTFREIYLSTLFPKKNFGVDKKWKLIINLKKEDLLRW